MRHYETTYIIDSLLKAEEIDAIISKNERFITANGGEILRLERLGKRRLAYEIKKRQNGYYVYTRFTGPTNLPKLMEREFRLNENILRYMTLLMDKKSLAQEAKGVTDFKKIVVEEDSPADPQVLMEETVEEGLFVETENFEAEESPLSETDKELDAPARVTVSEETVVENGDAATANSVEQESPDERPLTVEQKSE